MDITMKKITVKKTASIAAMLALSFTLLAGCTGSGEGETETPETESIVTEAPETETPEAEVPEDEDAEDSQAANGELTAASIYSGIMEALSDKELPGLIEMDSQAIESYYGLTEADYAEAACYMPMMAVHASEISVFRISDSDDAIIAGIDKRLSDLDTTWGQYLPDQHDLVKNAKVVTNGDWVLLAVSEYADEVVEAFDALTK